jgi:hypothetical protein
MNRDMAAVNLPLDGTGFIAAHVYSPNWKMP